MAYITHADRAFEHPAILSNLKATLAQRLAQFRTYRSTVNELAMLTDRELTDIGISRADIRSIARGTAYDV
ncbi:DUF1127 domain-containing protein [Rubellimicrobium roseum]|uniref:DUF1127 domain-containing protein n=1 Tax=Rubellimicrobium roseum TaxID=687525 RepID=A0A5C4N7E9_9RHOB|nr:DUF1127 domain-containing protein [Rubellimicrobium roseum]TNC62074.1 DUF1127 domain-containing protein [Rubellimicrobium roseum]